MKREQFLKQWPALAKNYQASPEVLKHISGITLCMIIVPSGVGKSSLIEQTGFDFVPSDTTRPARPGEQEGLDMYFRKDYDQVMADIKAGRFVQIAPFATGDFYATKATSYPASGVGIMPVMANVIPIFRSLGFKDTISAFITPPSYDEWMRRLQSHPVPPEKIASRMEEAKRSFDFALTDKQTHFILNDNLQKATIQVRQLLKGEIDKNREDLGRQAAQAIRAGIN